MLAIRERYITLTVVMITIIGNIKSIEECISVVVGFMVLR